MKDLTGQITLITTENILNTLLDGKLEVPPHAGDVHDTPVLLLPELGGEAPEPPEDGRGLPRIP